MDKKPEQPLQKVANSLNKDEIRAWKHETIVFSTPFLLAILNALSSAFANRHGLPTTDDLVFALGAGYSALLASLINLLGKYKQGV